MQKCPNCGVESADDAAHCGSCGQSLKKGPAGGAVVPKRTMMGVAALPGSALEKAIADAKAASAAQKTAKETGQPAPPAPAHTPRKPAATMLGFTAVQAPEVKAPKPAAPVAKEEDDWGASSDDAESWEAPGPVKPAPAGAKPIGMGTAAAPAKPAVPAKTVMFEAAPTPTPAPAPKPAQPTPAKTVMFEAAPSAEPAAPPAPVASAAAKPSALAKTVMFESAPTDAPKADPTPVPKPSAAPPSGLAKTVMFESAPTDAPPAATPRPAPRSRAAGTLPPQLARTAIMDAVDDGTADKVIAATTPKPQTPRTVPPSALAATMVGSGPAEVPPAAEIPRTPTPSPRPAPAAPSPVPQVAAPDRPSVPDPVEPDRRLARRACTALGVVLLGLFLVPRGGGAMAWDALAAAHGAGKLFAVWSPIAGAILLIAGLAPMGYALRAGIATVAGLVPLVGAGAGHGLPSVVHGVRGVLFMVGVVTLAAGCLLRARTTAAGLGRIVIAVSALLVLGLLFVPSHGQIALFAGMKAGGAARAVSLVEGALLALVLLSLMGLGKGAEVPASNLWGFALVLWLPAMAAIAGMTAEEPSRLLTAVGAVSALAYGVVATVGLYQIFASMQPPPA